MKLFDNALPTRSAKSIAKSVGLWTKYHRDHHETDIEEYEDFRFALIEFQQMSLICSKEDCMIAYHGYTLTEIQLNALDIIYKTTQPWLLGHVIGELLTLINHEEFKNSKQAVDAAALILDNLVKDGIVDKENAATLIINMGKPQLQKAS